MGASTAEPTGLLQQYMVGFTHPTAVRLLAYQLNGLSVVFLPASLLPKALDKSQNTLYHLNKCSIIGTLMASNEILHNCRNHADTIAQVKEQMSSSDTLLDLAGIFKVLGDHTRMRILQALSLNRKFSWQAWELAQEL